MHHKEVNLFNINFLELQLYHRYPNKNLTLGVRAVEKPPFIAVTPGGANFTLPGAVDFYVMNGDNTPLAFTLGVVSTKTRLCMARFASPRKIIIIIITKNK